MVKMIMSMTGFGRSEALYPDRKICVEIKSVNHRYLDINIKMPKKLGFFEASLRGLIKEYISRGKLDVFITYEDYTGENYSLRYNKDIAAAYYSYIKEMSEAFGLENDMTASRLSRYPEVFSLEEQEVDEKELWSGLEEAMRGALKELVASRLAEGESLKKDLTDKLSEMLSHVSDIEERAPKILEEYRNRLYERIKELVADAQIDDERILTEAAVYSDRICVDEEIVRLKSHIDAMLKALKEGGGVGRKLDFIAQEMNREANTILSKANDLSTSDHAIELKTGIEKVREQIQNLE